MASSSSQLSGSPAALLGTMTSDGMEEPPSPIYEDQIVSPGGDFVYDDSEGEYMRTWTSPDLPNPELLELLKVFPSFISRRPLPRFPVASNTRHADIEEGEDDGIEGKQIHFGTGSMWISTKQRSDGWEGGWWTIFMLWWRRTFC